MGDSVADRIIGHICHSHSTGAGDLEPEHPVPGAGHSIELVHLVGHGDTLGVPGAQCAYHQILILKGLRMRTMNDVIEELILLCEVRGELDLETNARNEKRIAELNQEYLRLQALEITDE